MLLGFFGEDVASELKKSKNVRKPQRGRHLNIHKIRVSLFKVELLHVYTVNSTGTILFYFLFVYFFKEKK